MTGEAFGEGHRPVKSANSFVIEKKVEEEMALDVKSDRRA